jgi:DNA-binding MarR family transcriptional regulator
MQEKLFDSEAKVMEILWEKGAIPAKEVSLIAADTIGWNKNTTYTVIKKLESKGYITRHRSKEDERNLLIKITPEGEALKERATAVPAQMGKCFDLDPEEAKLLYNLMYKLLDKFHTEE